MIKIVKIKIFIIMLVPVIIILNEIVKSYPKLIESYYSNSMDKFLRQVLSNITGVFPFSVAEFLVLALIIIFVILLIIFVIKIISGEAINHFINISVYISILYILFMLLWGLNYDRLSFDKITGLKIEKSSKEQLIGLCKELINKTNTLRSSVQENSNGIMIVQGGVKSVLLRATKGYDKASKVYEELGGKYGPPKAIFFSNLMSYTGITGIYMPYTGEANVNVSIPDFMLPFTTAHEMAHQRGFAREDEANYIAYVVCSMHPDVDFKYSGAMLALINSMNALYSVDTKSYKLLYSQYSEGVKKDLDYNTEFWLKYRGKVERITNKVNDSYLKSNGQNDGVESYGRMVDLLLAEYKNKESK
jgi:hypothetical protein